jgi:hypothetical protein
MWLFLEGQEVQVAAIDEAGFWIEHHFKIFENPCQWLQKTPITGVKKTSNSTKIRIIYRLEFNGLT